MKTDRLLLIEAIYWRWVNFARRRRGAVIGFWIVVAMIAGLGLIDLRINTDTRGMIDPNAPFQRQLNTFEEAFPGIEDQVLVVVRGRSQDEADRFASRLSERLTARDDIVTAVFAPSVDPFFEQAALLFLDPDEVTEIVADLSRAAPLLERMNGEPYLAPLLDELARFSGEEAGNDDAREGLARVHDALAGVIEARLEGDSRPLSWRAAFSDEQPEAPFQTLLSLEPILDFDTLTPARRVREGIDQEAAAVREELGGEVEIFITGDHVLRSDELRSVADGIVLALAVSLALVGLLLLAALRSVFMAVMTLVSLVVSIVITGGIANTIFGQLNLVSIAFAVLMVGLGVDFAIHLALHAQAERRTGKSTRASLYRTSREVGAALLLTAPTTALAFLSFAPTKFVGMTQLGVIAGCGVLIAFTVATSFLPAGLAYLPPPKGKAPGSMRPRRLPMGVGAAAALGTVVIGGLGILLMPMARFDADPMSLRDPNAPSVIAFNTLFERQEQFPYRLSLLADDVATADALAAQFRDAPEIDSAVALGDFVPDDQYEKLDIIDFGAAGLDYALAPPEILPPAPGVEAESAAIARLRDALAEVESESARRLDAALAGLQVADNALRGGVEADVLEYWPYERDRIRRLLTAQPIGREDLPASVTSRFVSADGRARVEIAPAEDVRDPQLRRAFVDAALEIDPEVTGIARTVMDSASIVTGAMRQAAITALVVVAFLLWVVIRRAWLVAAMLAPLVLAGILTTATSVVIGLPFNFANVIVLPLLVGVGVDSGIHLAMRAVRAHKPSAVLMTTTPRAVFFSAVTTIASFGSLSLSAHRGIAGMGALLTIAIFWTLICTILVLPHVMEMAAGVRRKRGQERA
jgi:hopanoid biosynthesis associated RND transporter like protein HpnN